MLTWLLVNVWGYVLARLMFAFTLGNSGLMMATLAERAPPRRIAFALSTMNSAILFGAFLGPLVGGPIIDRWGFQTLWLIDTLVLFVGLLAMAFGYRDTFIDTDRGPILTMAIDSVFIITRSPRLRWLFPALFLMYAGTMITFTYVPLIAAQLYRGAEAATGVGIVLGASGFVTMVLSPYVGALADRFRHRRVFLITALVEIVLWCLPMLTTDFTVFTILWAIIYGVSSSVFALSFTLLSQSAASDVRGRVMSFAYLPVNIGGILGPLVGSLLIPISLFAIFPAAAMFTVLGVGMFVIAMRQAMTPLQAQATASVGT